MKKLLSIVASLIILSSCNSTGMNIISTKIIKNKSTNESEEYKSIKISEDEENDYFLEVKIPKGYRQVTWSAISKGSSLMTSFIPQHSSIKNYTSSFRISMELYPKSSLEEHLLWRKEYIDVKYSTYGDSISYDPVPDAKHNLYNFPESGTIIHEVNCRERKTIICLENQKEINIIKAYNGLTTFWNVGYSRVIDGYLSESGKRALIEDTKLMMQQCCRVVVVKKLSE